MWLDFFTGVASTGGGVFEDDAFLDIKHVIAHDFAARACDKGVFAHEVTNVGCSCLAGAFLEVKAIGIVPDFSPAVSFRAEHGDCFKKNMAI